MRRFAAILSIAVLALPLAARQSPQEPQPGTQAQQRPVFRGGTHFVRVDAYPSKDGKIVEGLKPEDFEIFEDGKPQQIDSFDFVRFESFTPEAERRDPATQRESFDKAADPRYRLFVVYVDMALSRSSGAIVSNDDVPHIRQPLTNFFERVAGPSDLFALLTTRNSVKDLVLAQKTSVTVEQVMDLWRANVIDRDEADEVIGFCPGTEEQRDVLKLRFRADATYTNLHDLIAQLGSLRQERKNVVLVSNLLPRWRPDRNLWEQMVNQRRGAPPVAGATRGRITGDDREIYTNTRGGDAGACAGETSRLLLMDFDPRYYELLRDAKRENVSFYVITPGGLQAPTTAPGMDAVKRANDDLISLAIETDGIAVTNTNDLNGGFKRIADDLAAYYVLGYYTTNTNFDGGVRQLKVRYKGTGTEIRARRQYRAPTREEIAALTASASAAARRAAGPTPIETALTVLERGSRPFAVYAAMGGTEMTVVTELSAAAIQAGRWKDGADVEVESVSADGNPIARARGRIEAGTYAAAIPVPVAASARPARVTVKVIGAGVPAADDWAKLAATRTALVGEPVAYRSSSRSARRPVAVFDFARNERIRIEWPVMAALDRREVRLLDRGGKPLPVELPLAEDTDKKQLVLDMALSGLGRGDYLIELTAGAGAATERGLLAVRIRP